MTRAALHYLCCLVLLLAAAPSAALDCASINSLDALRDSLRRQLAAAPPAAGSPGGRYRVPSPAERQSAASAITQLHAGNPLAAGADLAALGYTLCRLDGFEADASWWYGAHEAAEDAKTSIGWPSFLLRRRANEPRWAHIVLSVPHGVTELRVGDVGLAAFIAQPAAVRLLLLAPVHRCNREEVAPERYQGVTNQCAGTYRISDMAHVDDSLFQALHEAHQSVFDDDIVFSLHGQAGNGASVSAGLNGEAIPWPGHPASRFHARLATRLQTERDNVADISSCSPHNGPFGQQVAAVLCGTRNAQGQRQRDLGHGARFIHIEMDRDAREQPAQVAAFIAALQDLTAFVFAGGFE